MIVFYPDNSGMGLGQMGTSWVRYMESILKTAKPRNYKISQNLLFPLVLLYWEQISAHFKITTVSLAATLGVLMCVCAVVHASVCVSIGVCR